MRWLRSKKFWIGMLALLILSELILRFGVGLGDTAIYIEHPTYEYIYAPNQKASRFGNVIETNSLSMRSKPLNKGQKIKVLKIGDSVINGGTHVGNDELASTRMENELQKEDELNRVLNVSAGSWGPDNAYAYIEENGTFDAEMLLLVFSSHDYHDNRHFRKVVGQHTQWPGDKPLLAITDLWGTYLWPKLKGVFGSKQYDYLKGFDDSPINSGWEAFIKLSEEKGIPMIVYLHPEQNEVKNKEWSANGKALLNLLSSNGVQVIDGLDFENPETYYRDNIHLNAKGHEALANRLMPYVQEVLTK